MAGISPFDQKMNFEYSYHFLHNSMLYISYNILFHHTQRTSHPARSNALMLLLMVPSELVVEETSQQRLLSDRI